MQCFYLYFYAMQFPDEPQRIKPYKDGIQNILKLFDF